MSTTNTTTTSTFITIHPRCLQGAKQPHPPPRTTKRCRRCRNYSLLTRCSRTGPCFQTPRSEPRPVSGGPPPWAGSPWPPRSSAVPPTETRRASASRTRPSRPRSRPTVSSSSSSSSSTSTNKFVHARRGNTHVRTYVRMIVSSVCTTAEGGGDDAHGMIYRQAVERAAFVSRFRSGAQSLNDRRVSCRRLARGMGSVNIDIGGETTAAETLP